MNTTVITPSQLDSPADHLGDLAGLDELSIEVTAQGISEPPLMSLGPLHQLLSTLKRSGVQIVVTAPYQEELLPTSPLVEDARIRLLLLHADRTIGKGGRDLWSPVLDALMRSCRTRALQFAAEDTHILQADKSTQPVFSLIPESHRNALRGFIASLGINLPSPEDDPLTPPLALLAKEALDNSRIHAIHSVDGGHLLEGFVVLSLRRASTDLLRGSDDADPSVSQQWLRGLKAHLAGSHRDSCDLLEVTLSDCGEGIPATMKEDLDIYTYPHTLELKKVEDAFKPRGTRPSTRPHLPPSSRKGFGFSQMMKELVTLRGQMRIWTGRSLLTWSSLDEAGTRLPAKSATKSLFSWECRQTERTVGTSLSCVIPLDATHLSQIDTLFDH